MFLSDRACPPWLPPSANVLFLKSLTLLQVSTPPLGNTRSRPVWGCTKYIRCAEDDVAENWRQLRPQPLFNLTVASYSTGYECLIAAVYQWNEVSSRCLMVAPRCCAASAFAQSNLHGTHVPIDFQPLRLRNLKIFNIMEDIHRLWFHHVDSCAGLLPEPILYMKVTK